MYNVYKIDVRTAFLNGKINEDIYMKIPEGCEITQGKYCKFNKSLYGLKQASKCWDGCINIFIIYWDSINQ